MNLNGSLGLAVFIPVGFRYFPDYTAGIAGGYDIGRNIFGYDASSGDYRVIANGHPGKDTGLRTDPYVIADSHGKSVFQMPTFGAMNALLPIRTFAPSKITRFTLAKKLSPISIL